MNNRRKGGFNVRVFEQAIGERYTSILRADLAQLTHAVSFAAAFAPRTRLGILLRDQVTRLMGLPLVVEWALGGLLRDRLELPAYD